MDARSITHFIASTHQVFETMLSMPVTPGKPSACCTVPSFQSDVSGVIGMTGDVVGMVVLSFPLSTARGVLKAFTGTDIDPSSPDFSDAVGELVNMISGAAKARFEGLSVSISCPSVILGPGHRVQQVSDATCIVIPFECPAGKFVVEVAMRKAESAVGTKAA